MKQSFDQCNNNNEVGKRRRNVTSAIKQTSPSTTKMLENRDDENVVMQEAVASKKARTSSSSSPRNQCRVHFHDDDDDDDVVVQIHTLPPKSEQDYQSIFESSAEKTNRIRSMQKIVTAIQLETEDDDELFLCRGIRMNPATCNNSSSYGSSIYRVFEACSTNRRLSKEEVAMFKYYHISASSIIASNNYNESKDLRRGLEKYTVKGLHELIETTKRNAIRSVIEQSKISSREEDNPNVIMNTYIQNSMAFKRFASFMGRMDELAVQKQKRENCTSSSSKSSITMTAATGIETTAATNSNILQPSNHQNSPLPTPTKSIDHHHQSKITTTTKRILLQQQKRNNIPTTENWRSLRSLCNR